MTIKLNQTTSALPQLNTDHRQERWLFMLFILLIIGRLLPLGTLHLALFYDEAYYHFWAVHPDWGYYSKPPMVAWLIAATTRLFGHAEWAVRISSPLLYAGAAYFVYLCGKALYSQRVGLWAALIFYSSPLVTFNSVFVTTDAPLLLFWGGACWLFILALQKNQLRWWSLCGIALGLGLLSKYTLALVMIGMAIYLIASRSNAYGKGPWLALLLAIVIFLPNLIWNAQSGFISFVHTAEISKLSHQLVHPGKFFEFFGGQFLVFGPISMLLLLIYTFRMRHQPHWLLLVTLSWPLLLLMCIQAFLAKANANWAAPSYLLASLLIAAGLQIKQRHRWLAALLGLNIFCAVVLFSYPLLQKALAIEPTRHNTPYRRVLGWRELMHHVQQKIPDAAQQNWVSSSRMLLSYAHYYLSDWPAHQPTHVFSFNPHREIRDQFDLRYDIAQAQAHSFIFMSQSPLQLQGCFQSIQPLGIVSQTKYVHLQRSVYLYRVTGFKGYENCSTAQH
ncbi:ArnT family glycosyltransferase [Celerinatantimonas sp. YJH-8]|uniref:ArnT family glycosyltransferase n=1 Tax=Celerinatantimonas sp. YJH-8 TaxID=3228714 RepID=UPI0038BFF8FE